MKKLLVLPVIFFGLAGCSNPPTDQGSTTVSPKSVLLDQLKTTHTEKDWFVPVNIALQGVTADQAMWQDSSGNHSIGQLTHHLLFWNQRLLRKINDQPEVEFSGDNDETFTEFDQAEWTQTVFRLDSVLTAFEQAVEAADETKLAEWYPTIANISTHNAYHTGQIISVRKLQHSWNPELGVK